MKTALIDGDVIAYRCAASCEPNKEKLEREPFDLAILRADQLIYRILDSSQATQYRVFVSGGDNFRYLLYPDYKANRAKARRPEYLDGVREFLLGEWKAEICTGYEADDGIGIAANEGSIVCSNDKDFKQIPGEHYNFVREEFMVIDEDQAALNFWTAMLVGDVSDNVRGVDGIGPKKAWSNLAGLSAEAMYRRVRELYGDDERFILNYRLLRILRSKEEYEDLISQIQGQETPADDEGQDPGNVSGINK